MFHHPLPWKDYWTRAFSSCGELGVEQGGTLHCRAQASHGNSTLVEERSPQAQGTQLPYLGHTGSGAAVGLQASLLQDTWDHPGPGIEPMSPALTGGVFIHCANQRSPEIQYLLNLMSSPSNRHLIMYILDNVYNGQIIVWQYKHFYISKKLKWPDVLWMILRASFKTWIVVCFGFFFFFSPSILAPSCGLWNCVPSLHIGWARGIITLTQRHFITCM